MSFIRLLTCLVSTAFNESSTVEARKLEHQYPHALKAKYRGS